MCSLIWSHSIPILNGSYGKGRLDDGQKSWQRMEKNGIAPDIRSCNVKLLGLATAKKMREAVRDC